jgi:hypothetical protein
MAKMKITTLSEPQIGIPLYKVEFGSVVQRAFGSNQQLYLVIAACNGTGYRWLVTLPGANLKIDTDQSERVIVLDDVELIIGKQYKPITPGFVPLSPEQLSQPLTPSPWSNAPAKPVEQYAPNNPVPCEFAKKYGRSYDEHCPACRAANHQ